MKVNLPYNQFLAITNCRYEHSTTYIRGLNFITQLTRTHQAQGSVILEAGLYRNNTDGHNLMIPSTLNIFFVL